MAEASQQEKQNSRKLKDDKKSEKKSTESDSPENPEKNKKTPLDPLGYLLFFFLFCFAVIIDILPFITSGTSAIIDWGLDLIFWMSVTFSLMLITGDIMGSLIGKKQALNAGQTILEFFPLIDILPVHTFGIALIFLDLQTNIVSKTISKISKTKKDK